MSDSCISTVQSYFAPIDHFQFQCLSDTDSVKAREYMILSGLCLLMRSSFASSAMELIEVLDTHINGAVLAVLCFMLESVSSAKTTTEVHAHLPSVGEREPDVAYCKASRYQSRRTSVSAHSSTMSGWEPPYPPTS